MSDELLPEWLNLILDDFESSLSLPILVIIIICTAQFVFNHLFDIGYTIYRNVKSGEARKRNKKANNLMKKLKGMVMGAPYCPSQ
jgi:hypothetical protein